jgi:hypothetical protein
MDIFVQHTAVVCVQESYLHGNVLANPSPRNGPTCRNIIDLSEDYAASIFRVRKQTAGKTWGYREMNSVTSQSSDLQLAEMLQGSITTL